MKELLKSVEALSAKELINSYEKFPKFNSPHEGYAVIDEEIDEHGDDTEEIVNIMFKLWNDVKSNNAEMQIIHATKLKEVSIHAAAEAIQVAAMAQKYIDSLGGESS